MRLDVAVQDLQDQAGDNAATVTTVPEANIEMNRICPSEPLWEEEAMVKVDNCSVACLCG